MGLIMGPQRIGRATKVRQYFRSSDSASAIVSGTPETISSSTSFSVVSAIARSPTLRPRFSTITRSPTSNMSFRRCEMMICDTRCRLQLEHRFQQTVGRGHRQVGGGFVENHDLRLEGNGPRDGHRLLTPARKAFDLLIDRVHVDLQAIEDGPRVVMHAGAVDEDSEAARPPAEEDVLADIEISAQREVLVDHFDAEIAALVRALEVDRLSVDQTSPSPAGRRRS